MALQTLSELSGWTLEDSDQDIRERPLLNNSGRQVGVIKDLVVDLDGERVKTVVTDQGEAYAVEGLEIRNDDVVAHDPPISGGTSQAASMRPATAPAYHWRLMRPR